MRKGSCIHIEVLHKHIEELTSFLSNGNGAGGKNSSFANFGRGLAHAICKCAVCGWGLLHSQFLKR